MDRVLQDGVVIPSQELGVDVHVVRVMTPRIDMIGNTLIVNASGSVQQQTIPTLSCDDNAMQGQKPVLIPHPTLSVSLRRTSKCQSRLWNVSP